MNLIDYNMRRYGVERAEAEAETRMALVARRYGEQIESHEEWADLAKDLSEAMGCDYISTLAVADLFRKLLNNAEREQGIKELGDLLDDARMREAESYVEKNWNSLIEVEREP